MSPTVSNQLVNGMGERLCWFCRHFACLIGDLDHISDVTPRSPTYIQCERGHYQRAFDDGAPALEEVGGEAIRMAASCPDFELAAGIESVAT